LVNFPITLRRCTILSFSLDFDNIILKSFRSVFYYFSQYFNELFLTFHNNDNLQIIQPVEIQTNTLNLFHKIFPVLCLSNPNISFSNHS